MSSEATVIQRTALVQIGSNCSISFGESTNVKVRQIGNEGVVHVDGTLQTIRIDSTGLIDGDGTIYHSFSQSGAASMSTIASSVTQIDIDHELVYGLYDPAFDGSMQEIFGDYGPLAVFAMGVPFILIRPEPGDGRLE